MTKLLMFATPNRTPYLRKILLLLGLMLALLLAFSAVSAQGPFISITNPVEGAQLPDAASSLLVEGRAGNLNDVITVQAVDSNNQVIAQTTTNNPGSEDGPWAVTLQVAYDGPGKIVAFSGNQATGSVDATVEINVTFGVDPDFGVEPPASNPFLVISSPGPGAQLPEAANGVSINGRAGNLNDIITVQAVDGNNQVVAQATTNNPGSPDGPWAVFLPVSYVGPGRIVASSSGQSAEVSVTFGRQFVPASIVITNPANGATADVTSGTLVVQGTASNIFENNVVVEVRDAFNRPTRQTATTADLNGNWSAAIPYLVENGSRGSIRAFSPSPVDGSVSAESLVGVTFSSNCVVNAEWPVYTVQAGDSLLSIATSTGSTVAELTRANCMPNPNRIFSGQSVRVPRLPGPIFEGPVLVDFTSPAADGSVEAAGSITVTGTTTGTAEGNTFVRVIGPEASDVYDEQLVTVTSALADGQWQWQASLDASSVPEGARLTLFAYAVDASNGRVLDADARYMTYGPAFPEAPFITITSPQPYSQLDEAANGIIVRGRAGNLNDVITVQAVDDNNQVLAEATVASPGTADGEWSVILPVPETRRGQIVAQSGNPETQSVDATTAIDVVFGNPADNPTYVLLTYPLPNTVITNAMPYVITAGEVRGIFNDRVTVNVFDENNNIVLAFPAVVDAATGVWSVSTTANIDIVEQERLKLQVIATTPDGGVLAADRIDITTRPAN